MLNPSARGDDEVVAEDADTADFTNLDLAVMELLQLGQRSHDEDAAARDELDMSEMNGIGPLPDLGAR